jgi:hypothetical protein
MRPQGTVERAYELARLGPCVNVTEIREQLQREHYSSIDAHLDGQATHKHIGELCRIRASMEARMAPRT